MLLVLDGIKAAHRAQAANAARAGDARMVRSGRRTAAETRRAELTAVGGVNEGGLSSRTYHGSPYTTNADWTCHETKFQNRTQHRITKCDASRTRGSQQRRHHGGAYRYASTAGRIETIAGRGARHGAKVGHTASAGTIPNALSACSTSAWRSALGVATGSTGNATNAPALAKLSRNVAVRRPSNTQTSTTSACTSSAIEQSRCRAICAETRRLSLRALVTLHPHRYIMCSCLRLMRLGCGQFWPYFLPVVGAQLLQTDGAFCNLIYAHAPQYRYGAFSGFPFMHCWWTNPQHGG